MTDGKHKKRVRIKVNGEAAEGAAANGPDAKRTDASADPVDLSVADAVDVAFDDIMADARASRAAKTKKGSAQGAAGAAAEQTETESAAAAASVGGDDAGAPAAPAAQDAAEAGDELATIGAQRDEYLRHLQRLQADFDNYRKRVQRENEALTKRASEGVVESLLPVIDNMQRALAAAQQHEADALVEGVELVAGQFRSVLESHGLEDVPAEPGVPFDPTVHEAVLAQPHDEYSEGTITQVLERGYLLHGRLLRPTKVIVAA